MIYNQWYVVLESKELRDAQPLKITRFGENFSLWRDKIGNVCCVADKCCHRGASLSCGKIVNGEIQCPFHGFTFDKTGSCTHIPANGKNTPVPKSMKVPSYKTFEKYGFIWLWWGDIDQIQEDPFFFEELQDFSYSSIKDHWNVHYSRAIENQLDVVHLPFVHKTTIGRGNKTLVNGPVVIREKELLTFYVNNTLDDGKTKPLKAEEIKDYKKLFHLQFHYPNIWQNFISEKIRIFAAFVPVDEENSIIYIRYYQKVVTFPIGKQLVNLIGKISSRIILNQDKRIVETQLPKKSTLKSDEHIIPGDQPIVEYRLHRQELIERSKKKKFDQIIG